MQHHHPATMSSALPTSVLGTHRIDTADANFLIPSDANSSTPRSILLRGVNLSSSSKYPCHSGRFEPSESTRSDRDASRKHQAGIHSALGEEYGFYSDAEKGGYDGWFVDRPLPEKEAETHLRRLQSWGFTTVRLIVTWEALEHAGPGKYDEKYIDYLVRLLQKCKSFGFRVFISPHQDVFSRFVGGSGAPYWVLEAFGINPRRIHSTGSAVLHSEFLKHGFNGEESTGEYPDMIWNSNANRLAARHCLTMFFASKAFAPKCTIDGLPAGEWARGHFIAAYGHLADRLHDVLDTCVIGWDTLNEPHEGFIDIPNLEEIPPSQEFRKGRSPTPIQGFRLGVGETVDNIAMDDFTSLGLKRLGNVTHTPPPEGLWLTREEAKTAEERWGYKWGSEWNFWDERGLAGCPWAGHGVWDRSTGKTKSDYFKLDGQDFMTDFWKPWYIDFISRIRKSHPDAISFIHPAIFDRPPQLDNSITNGRLVVSSHFYDGLTMLSKRRPKFNADTVGMHRGQVGMLGAAKSGASALRGNLRNQFAELKSDALDVGLLGARYPTLIGELGSPFDMKKSKWLGILRGKDSRKDYREPAKALDELLNGCDGDNALSWTLWDYEPTNSHEFGDGWNQEDLSVFSFDELDGNDDLKASSPQTLQQLYMLGTRGIDAWCRPYPVSVTGRIKSFSFDMGSTAFDLIIETSSGTGSGSAVIFLPFVHYLGVEGDGKSRMVGQPEGEWRAGQPARIDLDIQELTEGEITAVGQLATWSFPLDGEVKELHLKLRRWGDKPDLWVE
ncbi:glycoside hydrolase superfamily [Kockovaella imperatae]|uniref:Glycoside hydrolase superfamily n=1 Tax=Kockovaella imperatae TaxID=4999 RepID=A0A1Y1UQZ3_9TREE|nr:glycoside hydrolase superfamily [Kockovaella imperatae]ORX39856.1 glycoside hydrolase superfamily [Kockovaella imperatae]